MYVTMTLLYLKKARFQIKQRVLNYSLYIIVGSKGPSWGWNEAYLLTFIYLLDKLFGNNLFIFFQHNRFSRSNKNNITCAVYHHTSVSWLSASFVWIENAPATIMKMRWMKGPGKWMCILFNGALGNNHGLAWNLDKLGNWAKHNSHWPTLILISKF